MTTTTKEARRLSVSFSDEAYETLDRLAKSRRVTLSEVLRHAIALEDWFERTRSEGGRILVERDGEIRELITI